MSQDDKFPQHGCKTPDKADYPTLIISRNSSVATDDGIMNPSRIKRTTTAESDYSIHRAPSDERGFQSSIHLHLRDSSSNQNLSDYISAQSPSGQRYREPFRSMPTEDMSEYDTISVASDTAQLHARSSSFRSQKSQVPHSAATINYHGVFISQAASQGNLPLCVLLWGMATAKRVRLMDPDSQGDTPMHFAAMADLPEVMSFLHQQTRVKNDPQNRLVGLRNHKGETPLHRAACIGKIPALKFLLDSNSDPFAVDLEGNTVFINLTKSGCIWGLHFVYSYLCGKHGVKRILELLCNEDFEGHNALHWAAHIGDVNLIEYLARKNMDPFKTDRLGRNALHIAAMCCRVEAFIFLVKCGCDPRQVDRQGDTPLSITAAAGFSELASASCVRRVRRRRTQARPNGLACPITRGADSPPSPILVGIDSRSFGLSGELETDVESAESDCEAGRRVLPPKVSRQCQGRSSKGSKGCPDMSADHMDGGITLYATNSYGKKKPHAMHRLKRSRPLYALFYSAVVLGYWLLTIALPFYAWIVLVVLTFLIFRRLVESVQMRQEVCPKNAPKKNWLQRNYQELVLAPERYLGAYGGCSAACVFFWLCSLRIGLLGKFEAFGPSQGEDSGYSRSLKPDSIMALWRGADFLTIGGLSASTDDFRLFISCLACMAVASLLWIYLVWGTDPGAVTSRNEDFDMIMDQALINLAPPSDRIFCSTSFVRKPTRSKYCAQTGFVIARMDHYCVWLNNSVGFGNHRAFMLFLAAQLGATATFAVLIARALTREVGLSSTACGAASYLLDRQYFFPTTLCVILCVISLVLAALLAEQSGNVARNITANERINRSRYPWMNDASGKPFNHFDRGFLKNVLEFWGVPGYTVDYFNEFDMTPAKGSDKATAAESQATGTSMDCLQAPALHVAGRSRSDRIPQTLLPSPPALLVRSRSSPTTMRQQSAQCQVSPAPEPPRGPVSFSDSPMVPEATRPSPTRMQDAQKQQAARNRGGAPDRVCDPLRSSPSLNRHPQSRPLHHFRAESKDPHSGRLDLDLTPNSAEMDGSCSRFSRPSSPCTNRQGMKRARHES